MLKKTLNLCSTHTYRKQENPRGPSCKVVSPEFLGNGCLGPVPPKQPGTESRRPLTNRLA